MKIFIDEGHNYFGADTGACGNGIREQDISHAIGQRLGAMLQSVGVTVMHSRPKLTDNVGRSLYESLKGRYSAANQFGADYYISLHCDSSTSDSAHGAHVCVFKKGTSSEKLAAAIVPELLSLGLSGRACTVVARPDLCVLKRTNMPAVLVEMGFISNSADAAIQKCRQDELAAAIFNGVCKFLGIKQANTATVQKDISVYVCGKRTEIDAKLFDGKTYVPVRDVCEKLGHTVEWNAAERSVSVK